MRIWKWMPMAKMTRITGTSRVAMVKVIQILTPAELAWRMKTTWNFIDVPYGQVLPFIFFRFLMNLSIMFWNFQVVSSSGLEEPLTSRAKFTILMLLLFWGPKSAELMLIILLNVVVLSSRIK